MRNPEPTPIPAMPPAPEGELIPPVDIFPTPLPLDPLPTVTVLAETGAEPWSALLAGVLLLAVGVSAWWFGREVES